MGCWGGRGSMLPGIRRGLASCCCAPLLLFICLSPFVLPPCPALDTTTTTTTIVVFTVASLRAAPVKALTAALDAPEEALEAALSFLQADDSPPLFTLPTTAARVEVRFHRAAPKDLAGAWPVAAGLLRCRARCYAGTYRAAMPDLVDATGLPPGELVAQLSSLAAAKEVSFDLGRDQALAWKVVRAPQADELPGLAGRMADRLARVVASSVARLDAAYAALAGAAMYGGDAAAQERHLRGAIRDYFDGDGGGEGDGAGRAEGAAGGPPVGGDAGGGAGEEGDADGGDDGGGWDALAGSVVASLAPSPVSRPPLEQLRRAVRGFLRTEAASLRAVGRERLSGLAVARMLAGLGSPAFPSDTWRRVGEWGRLQAVDFPRLVAAADAELPALWEE